MNEMKLRQSVYSNIVAVACNIVLAYVAFMLCRIVYVWENWTLFSQGWSDLKMAALLRGGLRFDSSAIFYINSIYIALMLLPLQVVVRRWWQTMTKWIFLVVNSVAVTANLCDAVYSQFTGRRTTSSFFREFSNEDNLGGIFFTEVANHWYLVLVGAAIIVLMVLLYVRADGGVPQPSKRRLCLVQSVALLLMVPVSLTAMRGGIRDTYRPINLATANQYVNQPYEAAIVLNTPFTLIRTIGKTTFADPKYFDGQTLQSLYTPLHIPPEPDSTASPRIQRNVVVIIVESFAREYTGFYNKRLEDGKYKGYTPFVDSLLSVSLTWEETFANGRKSIDAMPSILASIPMFVEPFFMTGYSLNRINSLASLLGGEGYSSAFFHGANNGSMGFENFAYSAGFEHYYGRNEYKEDARFGGDDDFDGTWAIWDEPFLQYYATKMGEMREPFVTAVFTASSHHPFVVPDKYKSVYKEEELVMHKCIRYTDNALRRFFATASRQPWFKNTIFVICNDHTNMSNHDFYMTPIGLFRGTLFIYDPSGETPTGIRPGVAQQIDIMPTLLGILGYDKPYVAFGEDLLAATSEQSWTVNYDNGIYQYLENDTLIQYDGDNVIGVYKLSTDPLMKKNLHHYPKHHTDKLKAIIQQYMRRMEKDELVY